MVAMSATPGAEQNGSGGELRPSGASEAVRIGECNTAHEPSQLTKYCDLFFGTTCSTWGDCKTSLTDLSVIVTDQCD